MLLRNFAFMRVLVRKFRSPPAVLIPFLLLATAGWAAPARVQLQVTGYLINADLYPADNKLTATAEVTFTALEDLTAPVFELNNGLQLTKVIDAAQKPLDAERITTNSTVRFNLANPIPKGKLDHLDLRVLRHSEGSGDQPGGRHQLRFGAGSDQRAAVSRPLVSDGRALYQPLHRRDAHPRPG